MEAGGVELLMQKLEKFFYRVKSLLQYLNTWVAFIPCIYLHFYKWNNRYCVRNQEIPKVSHMVTLKLLPFSIHGDCICPCCCTKLCSHAKCWTQHNTYSIIIEEGHQVHKVTLCNSEAGCSVPVRAWMLVCMSLVMIQLALLRFLLHCKQTHLVR